MYVSSKISTPPTSTHIWKREKLVRFCRISLSRQVVSQLSTRVCLGITPSRFSDYLRQDYSDLLQELNPDGKVKIFILAFGSPNQGDTSKLEEIACTNNGYFSKVYTFGDVVPAISNILAVFGWEQKLKISQHHHQTHVNQKIGVIGPIYLSLLLSGSLFRPTFQTFKCRGRQYTTSMTDRTLWWQSESLSSWILRTSTPPR